MYIIIIIIIYYFFIIITIINTFTAQAPTPLAIRCNNIHYLFCVLIEKKKNK